MNYLFQGSCIDLLKSRVKGNIQLIIADPPDNLGLNYGNGYRDNRTDSDYYRFLREVMTLSVKSGVHFWLSYYWRHDLEVSKMASELVNSNGLDWKKYIWRFTFGQHRESDCGSGFRFLLRLSRAGQQLFTSEIRQPSKRQTIYKDSRANKEGRVPDDVWDFPRVVGNSNERRSWHPTQHPTAVYARIMRLCSRPGDAVIDLFGGTGTLFRANGDGYKRRCLISEISSEYCREIEKEWGIDASTDVSQFSNF